MPDALFFQATVLDGALAMPLSLDACVAPERCARNQQVWRPKRQRPCPCPCRLGKGIMSCVADSRDLQGLPSGCFT